MKKYIRLRCTICKHEVDEIINLTHYVPDQCTITLGCEGRLQPVEYLSNGNISSGSWYPRGTQITTRRDLKEASLIDLETGSLKQIVLATLVSSTTQALSFKTSTAVPRTYRQYVFRKGGAFTTISGVEDGLEKKTLRFTTYGATQDTVDVFVNGVKRAQGTGPDDYQVYNGAASSSIPPNTILFNNVLQSPNNTQVDVIVSREPDATAYTLTFKRNSSDESRIGKGAYENVSYVDKFVGNVWKRYYLYTLDLDTITIPLNLILVPSSSLDAFFLLAREPYTQLDRYSSVVVSLSDFKSESDYIKYHSIDDETTLQVTETAVDTFFPPLRFGKFSVEKILKTEVAGVSSQFIIDGNVVIGPDS